MFKRSIAFGISCIMTISGCATSEKSIFLGSGIGMGVGAGLGAAITSNQSDGNPGHGALIGALVGVVAGGLMGLAGYKDKRKKELGGAGPDASPTSLDMSGNTISADRPKLKPAQIRVHYVEDQVKDGTFIPAHFEYLISEPAHWEGSK
jgi:hypothetical protein